jgi:hypothetical protein
MRRSDPYPGTVEEILDPKMKFRPDVLRGVRAFARSRPWRGTIAERPAKFRALNRALAAAYEVAAPTLVFGGSDNEDSCHSCYIQALDTIFMRGRLSVITYLHEWGHKRFGRSEIRACRWSVNLFARCFPKSFARLRSEGHMCRRAFEQ